MEKRSMSDDGETLVALQYIETRIYVIRGQKVMLDQDLAVLYGVDTKALTRSVRRNIERFPEDFMFLLTRNEYKSLRCQIGTSNRRGGRRYPPHAFTEHGVAMLSSVLNSKRAIRVNIEIMRTFSRLKGILAVDEGLASKIAKLEKRYDAQFKVVFDAIRQLMHQETSPGNRIGFTRSDDRD